MAAIDGFAKQPEGGIIFSSGSTGDPTERAAEAREYYVRLMGMVEQAAAETDLVIGPAIFKAVTNGMSYDILKARIDIPCCKDTYYDLYRKFFWVLSKIRK